MTLSSIANWARVERQADVANVLFRDMIQQTTSGMKPGAESQEDFEDEEGEGRVGEDGSSSSVSSLRK